MITWLAALNTLEWNALDVRGGERGPAPTGATAAAS